MRIRITKSFATACLVFIVALLSGCVGTNTLYSNVFIKPSQPITEIKVLYLENKMVGKGNTPSSDLATIGYNDLPELLKERVPLVFGMNNLRTSYATVEKRNFGQQEAIEAAKWTTSVNSKPPLLVIQVVNGTIATANNGNTTIQLNMHANLFEGSANARLWTGQFRNTLYISLLGRIGFDNAFADSMLKTILEQMAKDGIIKLPDNKAVIPLQEGGNTPQDT